ncbi:hypothetical protein D7207_36240 [Burkholderia cepacia]|nr:hypothetical protein [Burkholderia cepacia]MBA9979121.1 hypothetical protein [Burkholderia cepacia]MBA9997805.1 hypothetical protein [Burkholderia cepacia]MBB0005850.1 hypothetical protein [Burkholderia cepacia]MBB0013489.1 hypothetical protein [Burkholderia cepacia]
MLTSLDLMGEPFEWTEGARSLRTSSCVSAAAATATGISFVVEEKPPFIQSLRRVLNTQVSLCVTS